MLCPYCLEGIQLDLGKLFVPDERMQYQSLDLSRITNPVRREDVMRGAVQQCTADPDFPEHHIPVPYLTHGRPLTVAMIGQSNTGKSHLLTQMIAEITDGGLAPTGWAGSPSAPSSTPVSYGSVCSRCAAARCSTTPAR